MAIAFPDSAAECHEWQVQGAVRVAVTHAGAVEQERVIEDRAVTVRRRPQLLHEFGEQLHVMQIDQRMLGDLRGFVAMVRDGVMRVGHAEVGVGPHAEFARHHEGEDARDVGLAGHGEKVEQQSDVLHERRRYADRRIER